MKKIIHIFQKKTQNLHIHNHGKNQMIEFKKYDCFIIKNNFFGKKMLNNI